MQMLMLIRNGFDIIPAGHKSITDLETLDLSVPILFWLASDTNILLVSLTCKWEQKQDLGVYSKDRYSKYKKE